jgi:hypothetical protein
MRNVSQHSQRTQFGPSRGQVVVVGLSTAASAAGTAYVFTMPGLSVRELVACLMGATLAGLLAMHTLSLAADRAVARDRAERAAKRERRETSQTHAELNAWQNAAAGLLDAYLTGRAVNFGGEVVPDYVRARLADLPVEPEPVPTSPAYAEPRYGDHAPLAPPMYPDRSLDLTEPIPAVREPRYEDPVDQGVTRYLDEELDPLGYQADPERPWRAFEPRHEDRVAVPLPAREVPVSPGRGGPKWSEAETEVISRVRDEDQTQVIPAQS